MSADQIAVLMVLAMAPAVTLFPIVYGFTSPWWRTAVGRSLMMSSTGLALLVDISILYQVFGNDYALRDAVRLSVFGVILLGAWMKLFALIREKQLVGRLWAWFRSR